MRRILVLLVPFFIFANPTRALAHGGFHPTPWPEPTPGPPVDTPTPTPNPPTPTPQPAPTPDPATAAPDSAVPGTAAMAGIGAWKKCYLQGKAAPYILLDAFVRGNAPESMALPLFPFLLWMGRRWMIKGTKRSEKPATKDQKANLAKSAEVRG